MEATPRVVPVEQAGASGGATAEGISCAEEVVPLPKYLIDRNFSKITEDELGEFARNSKRIAIERFHEVIWHHSHVVIYPDGVVHTFCIYSAPTEAMIREHAKVRRPPDRQHLRDRRGRRP